METLVINGTTYVKASKAARDLGYAADYVGQLCRGKHIKAHLVGRTWYVNVDELSTHRVEKKRMSRIKAREQAHRSIEEHRKLQASKADTSYTSVAVHYEHDATDLIPATRKVSVDSEPVKPEIEPQIEPQTAQKLTVKREAVETYALEKEMPKKNMVFSGTIKVVDASDDIVAGDTTLLTPQIREHHVNAGTERHYANIVPESAFTQAKSERADQIAYRSNNPSLEEASVQPLARLKQRGETTLPMVALALLSALTVLSIMVETHWVYTAGTTPATNVFETSHTLNLKKYI